MRFNSLNMMVKVATWIKRWLDLSHPEPWRKSNVLRKQIQTQSERNIRQSSGMGSESSEEVSR